MSKNEIIRLLFSVSLISIGAVMIVLHSESPAGTLLSHIGFAFVVAGVMSLFHEAILRRFEQGDVANETAGAVIERLKREPLLVTGIRLVATVRKGYPGYYLWAMSNEPQELCFAGRSVLHRIARDCHERKVGSAEERLARKLFEGAKIKILLVDPRSNLIPRLAVEEGQTPADFLADLAVSLGVCRRLYELLAERALPTSAKLDIYIFDEIPYFAYHRVDHSVIVGFYFSLFLGHQSAAYEVMDVETQKFFENHFDSVLARAQTREGHLLRSHLHNGQVEFNERLFAHLISEIAATVGEGMTEKLVNGEAGIDDTAVVLRMRASVR